VIRRTLGSAAALATAALLVAGCSSAQTKAPSTSASQLNDQIGSASRFDGIGLSPAQPRPSFTLTDTAGKSFSFAQRTAGHPTLLYFGYTQCPDVCPATMADIGLALKTVPAAVQKQTYVVFVSTDVKHDTGQVIAQWLSNFAPNTTASFIGLRGTQAQVDAAQTAAHIEVAQDAGQTHSALVLLYGADNYARVSYAQSTTEQQAIAHDVPLVAGP
jgi:protein SCO1/2